MAWVRVSQSEWVHAPDRVRGKPSPRTGERTPSLGRKQQTSTIHAYPNCVALSRSHSQPPFLYPQYHH